MVASHRCELANLNRDEGIRARLFRKSRKQKQKKQARQPWRFQEGTRDGMEWKFSVMDLEIWKPVMSTSLHFQG